MRRSRGRWLGGGFLISGIVLAVVYAQELRSPVRSVPSRSWGGIPFSEIPGEGSTGQSDSMIRRFWLATHEITVEQFAPFARETRLSHAQLDDAGSPLPGQADYPLAFVDRATAEAFGKWFSAHYAVRARLPLPEEWAWAARGGIEAAPHPWGFGPPGNRARFNAPGPAPVKAYPPNGFGLYDVAGNVFEWCGGDASRACGGAWSERDVTVLNVEHIQEFPPNYRDADLGFRLLIEAEEPKLKR